MGICPKFNASGWVHSKKDMKKIIYSFLSLVALATLMSSCRKNVSPLPEARAGAMVLLEAVNSSLFDVQDLPNARYTGTLRDPRGNVASMEVYAKITRSTTAFSELKFVKSITNVNGDFEITASEVAIAVGTIVDTLKAGATDDQTINLTSATDLQAGDKIDFINRVKDKEGVEHQISDISQNLNGNVGQRSAYDFTTFVSCPFVAANVVGTYSVVDDPFGAGLNNATRKITIEPGSGADKFIIKDIFGHFAAGGAKEDNNYDVVVGVNAATGEVTVEKQHAWDPALINLTTTDGTVEGAGFVLTCTGAIRLTLTHRVSTSTYPNTYVYNLQKD
ncbi:hypothetical protein M23134_07514 [Microscilla marina ATCC 23134]|uniref:Uncharacterized protein n=2 Tax=Microscilla marina TaxID=1027 RepID=A1ZF04_MICM2|nr:hypothetical protein M23134_07514 [Microscilla marina ATCC 23134]